MFPFSQPPSKLELAKKGVSDAAHHLIDALPVAQIEEKLEDLKHGAALAATAASVAVHHAGEVVSDVASHQFGALQSAAAHLGEGVSGVAHTAQSAAQSAAQNAQSTAKSVVNNAQSVAQQAQSTRQSAAAAAAAKASAAAQSARETAQSARESIGETAKNAAHLKDTLRERAATDFKIGSKEAQNAKAVAQKAAEREASAVKARVAATEAKKQAKILDKEADAAQKEADVTASQAKEAALQVAAHAKEEALQAAAHAKEEAKAKKHAAAEKIEHEKNELKSHLHRDDAHNEVGEVQVAESASKWGWIIVGLAVGAVLALLFAPTTGRRSRAAIKDRIGKVSDGAVDAATATSDKIVDMAQRVEGLAQNVETKLAADSETDDDATIADRVRSVLGHHEVSKGIERLNIDCADGIVTLRGPILDDETQQVLVTAIKTVPGVKDVVADFLTDETPEI